MASEAKQASSVYANSGLPRRFSPRNDDGGALTVPRVDFYRLTRDPVERVLPALATRILANGDRLLVVAASAMQRQTIDEALWTLQPASFLPHGHAGRSEERRGGKECVSTCRYRGSPEH